VHRRWLSAPCNVFITRNDHAGLLGPERDIWMTSRACASAAILAEERAAVMVDEKSPFAQIPNTSNAPNVDGIERSRNLSDNA
jgi:hypothetical protein